MQNGRRNTPVAALAVALAAAGAALAAAGQRTSAQAVNWPTAVAFLVLLAAAAHLMVRFHIGKQVMALDLTESVLVGAIFALPPAAVVGALAIALAVVETLHGNRRLKVAFNIAQWACAAAVGSVTFLGLARGPELSLRNVGALVAALSAVVLVNTLAFATVIRLAEGTPIPVGLRRLAPSIGLGWAVNTTFGLLLVSAFLWSPAAIGLFLVTMLVLHGAYRGHAAAVADRARLEGMHRATNAFAAPIDPNDAIPTFVEEVRRAFGAAAADLVLAEPGGRVVYRARGGSQPSTRSIEIDADTAAGAALEAGVPQRVTDRSGSRVGLLLAREGWRDMIAAPLRANGSVTGLLCTYDRSGLEGFEQGELAVLEALASEAAATLQKGRLVAEILEERGKLSDIVTSTSDGILTLDAAGTVLTWNPGLEAITGYPAELMLERRVASELRSRDPDGHDVMLERWASLGGPLPTDLTILTRQGEQRWLSCSYGRVPAPDGSPGTLIMVMRDRTRAHELETMKEDFISTVSHELRTPLTPIKGWANLLVESGDRLDDTMRRTALESILRQADRLEGLIANLLAASRLDGQPDDVTATVTDVAATVTSIVDDYRLAHPGRAITVALPRNGALARGPAVWIERIVSNLLSNAIKYAPGHEPIALSVKRWPDAIEIRVTDRGPGIADQDTEKIFDRFQRLGDPLTRTREGLGLGLYIARQLANALGATLSVESAAAIGTAFSLRLRPAVGILPAVQREPVAGGA